MRHQKKERKATPAIDPNVDLWRLFNRVIAAKYGQGDHSVRADEVMHACLVMVDSYCGQLPAMLRREQIDQMIDKLIEVRDGGSSI